MVYLYMYRFVTERNPFTFGIVSKARSSRGASKSSHSGEDMLITEMLIDIISFRNGWFTDLFLKFFFG